MSRKIEDPSRSNYNKRMFIDAYALISQQDSDGGDTLQREGMYAFGRWLYYQNDANALVIEEIPGREDPSAIMDKLEVEPGVFVRHPDPAKWYSNPQTTSRDQMVPVLAYCAAYKDYPRLWRIFKATVRRGFFAQNILKIKNGLPDGYKIPDTMLGHLGLFIRAGGYWTAPFYPVLFATDTISLLGTMLQMIPLHWVERDRRLRWRESRDVDDNNSIIGHLVAAHFKPTPISWLNRQLYSWTRKKNLGNTELGEHNPVMGALAWYHRSEALGNPEIAELYRPQIQKYFAPKDSVEVAKIKARMFVSKFTGRFKITSL